ncbi:hypothetical protein F4778DRAFT_782375 [Xylariomycetidae sp. FL2044]|nr:hypothetical protein F4778DRAFT_782375 [Xylariomycetidae sp. FL2044]
MRVYMHIHLAQESPHPWTSVSPLYGTGVVAGWLLVVVSLILSWTFTSTSRRGPESNSNINTGIGTKRLLASVTLPLFAALHILTQILQSRCDNAGSHYDPSEPHCQTLAERVYAIKAPVQVCDLWTDLAVTLCFLSSVRGSPRPAAGVVAPAAAGLLAFGAATLATFRGPLTAVVGPAPYNLAPTTLASALRYLGMAAAARYYRGDASHLRYVFAGSLAVHEWLEFRSWGWEARAPVSGRGLDEGPQMAALGAGVLVLLFGVYEALTAPGEKEEEEVMVGTGGRAQSGRRKRAATGTSTYAWVGLLPE